MFPAIINWFSPTWEKYLVSFVAGLLLPALLLSFISIYLDKVLRYENIIQAFSRTNRLFGPDKPFGTIKYYRKPYTMEKNIEMPT